MKGPEFSFSFLAQQYETRHIPKLRSAETCRGRLKDLISFFGDLHLQDITLQRIEEFKMMKGKTCKPATVNRYLSQIHKMLSLAYDWGWVTSIPRIHKEQENNQRDRWATKEEESLLLGKAPVWLSQIILFLVDTGCRISECLDLLWDDVDLDRKTILIRKSKNNTKRVIPMTDRVYNLLKEKKDNATYPLVFPNKYGERRSLNCYEAHMRILINGLSIKDFRPHDLRHTFATRLVQNGVDLYRVQKLLGHKSFEMTQRYAHHSVDSLRAAIQSL